MYAMSHKGVGAVSNWDLALAAMLPGWYGPQVVSKYGSMATSDALNRDAGTIQVTAPPLSSCPGSVLSDGSCLVVPAVNDPYGTTDMLSDGSNIQDQWSQWAAATSASAQTGNTTPNALVWLVAAGIAVVFIMQIAKEHR